MSKDPWTGARLGTDDDAPLGGSQLAEAVNELGKWTTPGFDTTADRDAGLAGWVANGGVADDGMTCTVTGIGLQRLTGGVWTNDVLALPTITTLSLTANYTDTSAPWGPAQVVQLGKRMRLQGSVTNGVAPASATKGTEYTIGNLAGGTALAPLNPVATSVPWGDGVSFIGAAILIVRPTGAVNFIPPADFSTGALHTMSLGVDAEWIIGE